MLKREKAKILCEYKNKLIITLSFLFYGIFRPVFVVNYSYFKIILSNVLKCNTVLWLAYGILNLYLRRS